MIKIIDKSFLKRRIFFSFIGLVCMFLIIIECTFLGIYRINLFKTKSRLKTPIICIDAGHGFNDSGAKSDFIIPKTEADINLEIATILYNELKELGYTVFLTHNGSVIPNGYDVNNDNIFNTTERVSYSDQLKPDVFVSIHCDSFTNDESVHGTRIYYEFDNRYSVKHMLVKNVANSIDSKNLSDKETLIKPMSNENAFTVICDRGETISFLIECGFITNKKDAENLCDPEWQTEFAVSVCNGIHKFCGN